jgi:hypothetical protein
MTTVKYAQAHSLSVLPADYLLSVLPADFSILSAMELSCLRGWAGLALTWSYCQSICDGEVLIIRSMDAEVLLITP